MLKKIKDNIYFLKCFFQGVFYYPRMKISSTVDYDAYWRSRREDGSKLNIWQKNRAEIIAGIIKTENDKVFSVLDIGCGDGGLLNYLSSFFSSIKTIGADNSTVALLLAKKLGIEVIETDIKSRESVEKLPGADYVLLLEVLEHMSNAEEILEASLKITQRGLFLSFPNSGYFTFRIRLLFGKFPIQWRVHPGEHLRFWTLRDVRWWLSAQGYKNYQIYSYQGIPLFNKLLPAFFSAGLLVYIPKNNG